MLDQRTLETEAARQAASDLIALPGQELAQAFFSSLLDDAPLVEPGSDPLDPTGDHVLNPDFADYSPNGGLKPAAVLIAVDTAAREPDVTLTVRTAHLSAHAGQIAFPGGRMDAGEVPAVTALREAHEEVALEADIVDLRGFLPAYRSRTGYRVFPVVGQVDGMPPLTPSPAEVDQIFTVPLRFLLNPANAQSASRVFEGKKRFFYNYQYQNHAIWGLTAGIVHHMSERLITTRI